MVGTDIAFVIGLAVGSFGVVIIGLVLTKALSGTPWRLFWEEQVLEAQYERKVQREAAEARMARLRTALGKQAKENLP